MSSRRKNLIASASLLVAASFWFERPPGHAEEPLPQVDRLKTSPVLRHLKPNPVVGSPKNDAEKTVRQIYVPEGFRVDLIAAEPDLHQPIAFAWDERGRIWVVEALSYPTRRPKGEGLDRIVILSDEDGDGRFENSKVFAEKLNLASAIEVGYGGIWVGAAPELLFIPDRNRDDKADGPPEILLDGFGYQDTHETLNSFLWGPDGWLYGLQGVFNTAQIGRPGASASERVTLRAGVWRYHPARRTFEVFADGGSNAWGLDYDEHGQFFMTHCRSYWGRGLTTHVIQGGQFWNQVNANYPPFIIANAPKEFPELRNYLLASARYDHGAGGAGEPGSDAIYGGHSHVGTMIYQGDNWPDEYRGHLFTHNLGGHQINQQINKPLGSGFDTVHAGKDILFCTDPKYVAVDLQYGPDGAVYIIDWYDQQHCHNPNTERWDRGNGRIYRMQWQNGYKPVKVDLASRTDPELVALLAHKNEWFVRTAQRLLHERHLESASNPLRQDARERLFSMATSDASATRRLRALWAANSVGLWDSKLATSALRDPNEFVRGWAVQFSAGLDEGRPEAARELARLAREDTSPVVRRYLASAIQRVSKSTAWDLVEALTKHAEDRADRNLPFLIWHGMAPLFNRTTTQSGRSDAEASTKELGTDLLRAFAIAQETKIPTISDWTQWYAATLGGSALNHVVASLEGLDETMMRHRLAGLWLAMESRPNVPMPSSWAVIAPRLYAASDSAIRRLAERLSAAFGDTTAFPRLRELLGARESDLESKRHAFAVLSRAQDRASVPIFLALLDDASFRTETIGLLARFDLPEIAPALLGRLTGFKGNDRAAALLTLSSRPSFAITLLDATTAGKIPRDYLTAFHVRQLSSLKDPTVDELVKRLWGRIKQTPAERVRQIAKLEKAFNEAPLWAYSATAGRQHFQKLCLQCHVVNNEGARLGPELTGAGKHGVRYFLENIIDPDAVVGTDFQMTTLASKNGDVLSGLLGAETATAITLRTTAGEVVMAKSELKERTVAEKSFMPEALLDGLNEREQIELLKFLTTN